MVKIEKSSMLSEGVLIQLQRFVKECAEHDGVEMRFLWEVSQHRQSDELTEFVFWVDGEIAGYLAMYLFAERVEIHALVHPGYRRQGVFSRLWQEVQMELKEGKVDRYYVAFSRRFPLAKQIAKVIGLSYAYEETRFIRTERFHENKRYESLVQVEPLTHRNLPVFCQLLQAAGEALTEHDIDYFNAALDSGRFRAYLAKDLKGKKYFGAIQGTIQNNRVHLYRLVVGGVSFQRGVAFMHKLVNQLLAEGITEVISESVSEAEQKFYEDLGFVLADVTEFWVHYSLQGIDKFVTCNTIH